MAVAVASPDIVAPDLLLSRTRFPFSLHHKSSPFASRCSFICAGYCLPEDEQDMMNENLYKVKHPSPRMQWYDANESNDTSHIIVISAKNNGSAISFCMRYFSDGHWLLTESITAALESISATNTSEVGYVPCYIHHGRTVEARLRQGQIREKSKHSIFKQTLTRGDVLTRRRVRLGARAAAPGSFPHLTHPHHTLPEPRLRARGTVSGTMLNA